MRIDIDSGIARFAGHRDRYLTVLRETLQLLPADIARIRESLDGSTTYDAQHLTHALKGKAGNLGLTTIFELLQQLERSLRQGEPTDRLLDALDAELPLAQMDLAAIDACDQVDGWRESYAIGIPILDSQHKRLFELVQQLAGSSEAKDEELHEMLSRLSDYARHHFATEEAYLRRLGLALVEQHAAAHLRFVDMVTTSSMQAMRGSFDHGRMLDFLRHWLVDHIVDTDLSQLRAQPEG